jgi:hypothetical protein
MLKTKLDISEVPIQLVFPLVETARDVVYKNPELLAELAMEQKRRPQSLTTRILAPYQQSPTSFLS